MYKRLTIAFLLFLFIFCFNDIILGRVSSVQHFTITQGLSNHSVNVIFQDSRGFLWIGTEDGLNRYDGYSFEVFKSGRNENDNIGGSRITAIAEDGEGNIWIGTKSKGISVLHFENGLISHFVNEPGNSVSLPENSVLGFHLTSSGEMWVKLNNYLSRFDTATNSFQSFGHFSNVFKRTSYSKSPIVQETDSTFLVGTNDGINRFNLRSGFFERLHIYERQGEVFHEAVNQIQEVDKNKFLVATNVGLFLLEPGKSMVKVNARSNFGLKVNVNAIQEARDGNFFLGTNRGLEKFHFPSLFHEVYANIKGDVKSIIPHDITVLFEDDSGILWVGTRFNGLYKVNLSPSKFSFMGEGEDMDFPMKSFNISAVYADGEDVVWLGTNSSGLYRVDRITKDVQHFVINKEDSKNGSDAVTSLFGDGNGSLWIGSNSGIFLLDTNRQQIKEFHYCNDAKYSTLLRGNRIMSITRDSSKGMWFGTQFGLYRYIGGKLYSFFNEKSNKGLVSDEISSLCADVYGGLWIGTPNGISYYDNEQGRFFSDEELGLDVYKNRQILSMAVDIDGKLWVGTRTGLSVIKYTGLDDIYYEKIEGFGDEMITAILTDHSRRIWVSSSKGVSMYSPDGVIRSFDVSDGLPGQLFNIGSASKANDGTLMFGSVNGLSWLHPDSIEYNFHKPKIAITGVSVCHKGECTRVLSGALDELNLKFKPGIVIEINYSALEFTQPSKNRYKLMLEGYDNAWRPVTNSNKVSFSNIMPGKYKLRIMASNNDFIWNNEPLELPIIISPPLWMTKYAYAFYLLLILFTVQSFVNYRIRHYKKANRTLTEKNVDKKKLQEQSKVLASINQNLTDSINYATRIQSAMMPSEKSLREVLPNSFVYFRPRDIVSGDFYWMHERDNKVFIAVVDCTGHGVPGAFMSIIGMDLLKNIIVGELEDDPAQILYKLSRELNYTLRKNYLGEVDEESIKDGMDMVICVINKESKTLEFSGAVNGIYLLNDNELRRYRGDRSSIGKLVDGKIPDYTNNVIPLEDGDMLYLFTDGYVDQFGGPEFKKFKYRRFRHLLLNIHKLHPDDQKSILHQKLEDWRGDNEQVDDILIVGFKLS